MSVGLPPSAWPEVQNSRIKWNSLDKQDRLDQLFQCIKIQVSDDLGTMANGRAKWTFKGQVVCRHFWAHVHNTSPSTIDKYRKHIREGGVKPPEHLPKVPSVKSGIQGSKADAWFLQLYTDLGEPYPMEDGSEEISLEEIHELVETPSHPLWNISVALSGGDLAKRYAPKRYLNPGSFQNLWDMYHGSVPTDEQVSKATLYNSWNSAWKKVLRFRSTGQGKRCKVCAMLDEARSKATTAAEKQQLIQEKLQHITEIKAGRSINVRGNLQSEHDSATPSGPSDVLKVCLDGMDQAKFRVPRNVVPRLFETNFFKRQCVVVMVLISGKRSLSFSSMSFLGFCILFVSLWMHCLLFVL